MSATTTNAPFSTNSFAAASPIPLAAPVIIATFPSNLKPNVKHNYHAYPPFNLNDNIPNPSSFLATQLTKDKIYSTLTLKL
jgi:hypothetical protein